MGGVTGIGMAKQPRAGRTRRTVIATALVGIVVGIVLPVGAWKWGWFGGNEKDTAQERVFDLGNGVELTLCWCPPGKFLMGSPATEAGRREDEVQHEVTLTQGFWMAKTETTQAQWKALMPDNPSAFQGDRLPVESVHWDEAKGFAAALTARMRREGKLVPGWKFRLPTEAQWEYACRAGTSTAYYTGDGEEALRKAGCYDGNSERKPSRMGEWLRSIPVFEGWFPGNTGRKTWPAGKKEENAFGLQDMHGNVGEWCEDGYREYGDGMVVDPLGPREGPVRVIRGGSWAVVAVWCRSACRDAGGRAGGDRFGFLGFRVCLVPGPAAEPVPQE
ncbi:MAG TPA: formylglycine-generating enzyme family protein [Verrucomicrobiales bacterium]|nr:formylglycine-generating enzyme family protein [Verrucomicrobiales bacterium]